MKENASFPALRKMTLCLRTNEAVQHRQSFGCNILGVREMQLLFGLDIICRGSWIFEGWLSEENGAGVDIGGKGEKSANIIGRKILQIIYLWKTMRRGKRRTRDERRKKEKNVERKKKRKNMKNEKGLTVLHITERRLIEKK